MIEQLFSNPFLWVPALLGVFYVYQTGSRKQEWIAFKVRRVAAGLMLYAGGLIVLPGYGYPFPTAVLYSVILGLAAFILVPKPKWSRRIPKHIKRAVIERDLPKGETYDSSRHHFDHTVPYSRGGDTSIRNLRLISKRENLRKGAKRPKLWDFFN